MLPMGVPCSQRHQDVEACPGNGPRNLLMHRQTMYPRASMPFTTPRGVVRSDIVRKRPHEANDPDPPPIAIAPSCTDASTRTCGGKKPYDSTASPDHLDCRRQSQRIAQCVAASSADTGCRLYLHRGCSRYRGPGPLPLGPARLPDTGF